MNSPNELIKYENHGFNFSLDPRETEERTSSIAFSLLIILATNSGDTPTKQKLEYHNPRVWIETDELDRFEQDLKALPKAELRDMSGFTLLKVSEDSQATEIEINPKNERMHTGAVGINAKLLLPLGSKKALSTMLNNYPKWW